MKGILLLLIITIPSIFFGQVKDWNSSIHSLNSQLKNVNQIIHFSSYNDYWAESDSMSIENNSDFEKVFLTLYHTEMAFEPDADYYIVGMDIPLLEIFDIEWQEHQLKLDFSRNCNLNSAAEIHNLILNFSSEKSKEKIYAAFTKLLKFRNDYHTEVHEVNQCTLETI
ncbi:hypothetical protein [Christiangramia echinicola]|uniref:hypothetical protein n=1 Tax=Christiangramia echinicola TaxID=279359 RepID=UPI00047DFB26|nr:hypothetical protein [Christiangramia echinicola]